MVSYPVLVFLALVVLFVVRRLFASKGSAKDLSGQIVLITGGARGIGRRMALEFAKLGAKIVLWDIREDLLKETASEVKKEGAPEVRTYVCDVSKREAVYAVAEQMKKEIGNVDVLVNNAGIVVGKPFFEVPDEGLQKTIEVNLLAHFWTVKAFVPAMLAANRGHVVTIASQAGIVAAPGMTEYCASKFGAFGFAEGLRREIKKLGKTGVNTSLICPGYINTGLFEGYKQSALGNLIVPPSDEADVARRVVEAVRYNQEQVIIPGSGKNFWLLRFLFSAETLDSLARSVGVFSVMDGFKGRKE